METYNAKLISADLEESTMEFEIQHEFTVKAGDYVILHKADYEKLVSDADLKNGKLPIQHVIKSVCDNCEIPCMFRSINNNCENEDGCDFKKQTVL